MAPPLMRTDPPPLPLLSMDYTGDSAGATCQEQHVSGTARLRAKRVRGSTCQVHYESDAARVTGCVPRILAFRCADRAWGTDAFEAACQGQIYGT